MLRTEERLGTALDPYPGSKSEYGRHVVGTCKSPTRSKYEVPVRESGERPYSMSYFPLSEEMTSPPRSMANVQQLKTMVRHTGLGKIESTHTMKHTYNVMSLDNNRSV